MNYIGNQKILLPKNVEMEKWAVVACDQFTSQPNYWERLEKLVGSSPSTLRLTLPEIYLGKEDVEKRIADINLAMDRYLSDGIFAELDGFVLVEREVEFGKKRIGLVLSIDLEAYDWRRVRCPIRATEDTILDRLPPRVAIRKEAKIELPHILFLIDDEKRNIIEPIYENRAKLERLYDFDLNMGGGRITGYKVERSQELLDRFYALLDSGTQNEKYGTDAGILFAVGDGNHSLATAKTLWNQIKEGLNEEEQKTHPARYALVEVVNLYDEAMLLEPIHRVIFGDKGDFISELEKSVGGNGRMKIITKDKERVINVPESASMAISEVQRFVERYIKENGCEVDYIHGDDHLAEVVKENDGIGIFMPLFGKNELFDYVINVGNLPKKAFSIGGPEFKKYYLEAKRIR